MHTPASLYHCTGGLASCHVDEKTLTKPTLLHVDFGDAGLRLGSAPICWSIS